MTNEKTYTFKFTTRETYLSYRADWKAGYADLAKEISDLKRIRAKGTQSEMSAAQSKLHYLSINATEMLAALKEAKLEAGRQWAASREDRVAA
jgi:hypothetical protein